MPRTVKEWIAKHDDQAIPCAVKRRKFQEAYGCCQGPCHRQLDPSDSWDLDHIKRLADGGENRESNLQVLCDWCHAKKTSFENSMGAKANRVFDRAYGIKPKKQGNFARLRAWRDRILAERPERDTT